MEIDITQYAQYINWQLFEKDEKDEIFEKDQLT